MDFFERQRVVRRLSGRLVLLFILAVVAIVVAVNVAVVFAFNATELDPASLAGVLIMTSVATLGAIGLAALFRTLTLKGGGGRVARELGGVLVPPDTTDPQLRRLRNVVEEIAIASGVPVPEIYLLPHEEGINAFAAGWSTSDAAVAVTRGTLEQLNRAELQGVIAHEFSHVINGDMRLNIRLIGLLFGILFLTVIGRQVMWGGAFSGRRKDGGNPIALIGLALVVVGFIGVLAGRVIQASVSRQREYLADASAVQFTRQTSGIAGALKKIAGLPTGSAMRHPKSEEVGHLLFGAAKLSSIFATHPPLVDRIKVLEPSFDPGQLQALSQRWALNPPSGMAEDMALGFTDGARARVPAGDANVPAVEADVVAGIATPTADAYERAADIIAEIPEDLLQRARNTDAAVALTLGLLIAADPQTRAAQKEMVARQAGAELAEAVMAEADALSGLNPLLRLPLAELASPALRQRDTAGRKAVLAHISALINADGRITGHEYCLSRLVHNELAEAVHPHSEWRTGHRRLNDARPAIATLLSLLAQGGHDDPEAARRAFDAGIERVLPGQKLTYTPSTTGVVALDTAWPSLVDLAPADKRTLVAGAVAVISDDGVTTITEMELLRTICALLHSPLPL